MKTKTFDCVYMMDKAALEIYNETRNMTLEEELKYWQDKNRQYSAKKHSKTKKPTSQQNQ